MRAFIECDITALAWALCCLRGPEFPIELVLGARMVDEREGRCHLAKAALCSRREM
jgi:hypothetical protein